VKQLGGSRTRRSGEYGAQVAVALAGKEAIGGEPAGAEAGALLGGEQGGHGGGDAAIAGVSGVGEMANVGYTRGSQWEPSGHREASQSDR
jgi:hypothetical protein